MVNAAIAEEEAGIPVSFSRGDVDRFWQLPRNEKNL